MRQPMALKTSSSLVTSIVSSVLITSCAMTAEYQPPITPSLEQYGSSSLPDFIGQERNKTSQKILLEQDIPFQWWALFQSETLNELIVTALQVNPELAAAEAAIRQARENHFAQLSTSFPDVDLSVGTTRQKFSGASVGFPEAPNTLLNLFNASVDVSYNIDLFDKVDNLQLSAQTRLNQEQWKREATYLALTANLVIEFIQFSALKDELRERNQLHAIELERLELLKKDTELGGTASVELLAQSNFVSGEYTAKLDIEKKLAFSRHQIAVLIGKTPEELDLGQLTLTELNLPKELPLSLPSQLVQQRPDIQLAENFIKSRHAELGIAIADQLPQLTLNGSYGTLSTEGSTLFDPISTVWNVSTGLTHPLFHGGELKHKKNAAEAALEESNALYRQTVLIAFKQVADSLRALEYDASAHSESIDSERKRETQLSITEQEKSLGAVSYLQVLEAKQQYHRAKINRIRAQASQLSDTVALFQALGGGWWNRQ